MNKTSKQKIICGLLLTVLSISCAYVSFIPNVQAAEKTAQQNGLTMMHDVVGLDLTKYEIVIQESSISPEHLGGVLQENILYNLTSAKSKLRVVYGFADGTLQGIYVLENTGAPILTKSVDNNDAVAGAKDFLSNYEKYTRKQIYKELESTLTNVNANKNLTKTFGDKMLQVIAYSDNTNFRWSYAANGARTEYTKVISMGFKGGFLSFFIDNWDMYPIGSNTVNLGKEEAVSIALNAAREHSWTMQLDEDTLSPENLNENSVSLSILSFAGSLDADKTRSTDVLELYPVWRITLLLNKMYGQLYGLEVDIWADNKEVRSVKEQYSSVTPGYIENISSNDTQESSVNDQSLSNGVDPKFVALISFSAVTTCIIFTMAVVVHKRKYSRVIYKQKPRFLRLFVILCSILILTMIFLPLVKSVSASRACLIWGSRSSDAISAYSLSWRKSDAEIARASAVTDYIRTNFFDAGNGYSSNTPNYGVDKDVILSQANTFKNSYDYLAILDWDHGVMGKPGLAGYDMPANEAHYMFEDDSGTIWGIAPWYQKYPDYYTDWSHGVYDVDMYDAFPPAKVHFAFINTCMSANITYQGFTATGNPIGLPFAFTHRIVDYPPSGTEMSKYGYSHPDAFPQCYMGFSFGSAALDQKIPYEQVDPPYWSVWVIFFFYFALDIDLSVHDALDMASYYTWPGCADFSESPLQGDGFTSEWPIDRNGNGIIELPGELDRAENCKLAVYGNSNIHLKNFQPSDYVTPPDISGPTTGTEGITYEFSGRAIDSQGHNVKYRFDWDDGSGYSYSGWVSNGEWGSATHSWDRGIYDVRVWAKCSEGTWSSWSEHTIAVGDPTVSFYDTYLYTGYPVNSVVFIDGDGGHQMPYESDISTTTTHDLEFAEVYGYLWVDHVVHHHGSTTTYYTNYLDDISVSDGDYFVAYYDYWGAFMMRMDDLGYDEEYIESLVFDYGISPQVLNSYVKVGYNLNTVGVLLDMGFQAESFQPIEFAQSTT